MTRLSAATIEELCTLRAAAKAAAEMFAEAIKTQAEAHELARGALRRYIAAKEADTLADLDAEASDLATLLETPA